MIQFQTETTTLFRLEPGPGGAVAAAAIAFPLPAVRAGSHGPDRLISAEGRRKDIEALVTSLACVRRERVAVRPVRLALL